MTAIRCLGRLTCLAGLAALCVIARPSPAADLMQAYALALDNDPTWGAERSKLDQGRLLVPQARSALLPSVGATGQVGREGGPVSYSGSPTVDRTFDTFGWTVQLSVPVLKADGIALYRESNREYEQAQAQFESAQQDLILRVTRAYFNVLIAQDGRAAADSEVAAAQEQAALAQHSYKAGASSVTDVDEATTQTQSALAKQSAAQADVEIKQATLESILGQGVGHVAPLQITAMVRLPDPADAQSWADAAKEHSFTVLGLQKGVAVARLEVSRAEMARLPTISVVASYGREYSSGNNTNPLDYSTNDRIKQAGAQFSLPILDGGAVQAGISLARAKLREAQENLEGAERQAVLDAKTAYQSVMSGLAQMKALGAAIEASKNAVKGDQVGYKAGLRINSDVLNAQKERYAAERDLSRVRYDTVYEGLKLKAAAGMLSVADLQAVNRLLEEDN